MVSYPCDGVYPLTALYATVFQSCIIRCEAKRRCALQLRLPSLESRVASLKWNIQADVQFFEFHAFPCEDQLALALVSQLALVSFHNEIETVVDACAKDVMGGRIGAVQTCMESGPTEDTWSPVEVVTFILVIRWGQAAIGDLCKVIELGAMVH